MGRWLARGTGYGGESLTPVDQQILHDPENGRFGDCQRACIASLLDLRPDDVPHFYEDGTEITFWKRLNSFLASIELVHLETQTINFRLAQFREKADLYHMIYGQTERGTQHAVIGLNGDIIHDPHPSKAGFLESDRDNWTFAFLVKAQ